MTPKELARALVREWDDPRLYNLMLDVNNLKKQLHELTFWKNALQMRDLFTCFDSQGGEVLKTVHHYFKLLHRGFYMCPKTCSFIASMAVSQLSLGAPAYGLDMLLEQWRRYTEIFHSHTFSLLSARVILSSIDQSYVVRSCVILRGVLTHEALATVKRV